MVRDDYFEPSLGHAAARAQAALALKAELGRAALFEIHRFNFLGADKKQKNSLDQVSDLLKGALSAYPSLAFLTTERLAGILHSRHPEWVELRLARRIHVWIRRLREFTRLRKLAWWIQ